MVPFRFLQREVPRGTGAVIMLKYMGMFLSPNQIMKTCIYSVAEKYAYKFLNMQIRFQKATAIKYPPSIYTEPPKIGRPIFHFINPAKLERP